MWLQRDSDCSLLKAGEERRVTKDGGGDVQLVSRWDRLIEGERGGAFLDSGFPLTGNVLIGWGWRGGEGVGSPIVAQHL